MKNKPTRHKESNTFKFKPFSERVGDIDVDVFHRVPHRNEVQSDEEETFFYQSIQKWNQLNLSENYGKFRKEVHVRNTTTLPLLLLHQQHVIDTLLQYLQMKDSLCVQPLLELTVAVAKDLRKDFCGYFPIVLATIVELLQTKDAEQLEMAFTTLAYLFKHLGRYFIKEDGVQSVFNLLLPLLNQSQPEYTNRFAAESFAFVVRKYKDKKSFLKFVLQSLKDQEESIPGCGKLLFEVISGVQGQFHSCAEEMLMLYFDSLRDEIDNQNLIFAILKEIIKSIVQHIHPLKCDVLWNVILRSMETATKTEMTGLVLVLHLASIVVDHNGGKMLEDPVAVAKKLTDVLDRSEKNDVLEACMSLMTEILLAPNVKLMQETSSYLILKMLSVPEQNLLLKCIENLVHHVSFETIILPHLVRSKIALDSQTLRLYSKIIAEKVRPTFSAESLEKWTKYDLDINLKLENGNFILNNLKALGTEQVTADAIRTIIVLPHLTNLTKIMEKELLNGIISLYGRLSGCESRDSKLSFAFLLAFDALVHITTPDNLERFLLDSQVDLMELAKKNTGNCCILNALDLHLSHSRDINESTFEKIHGFLSIELSSPNPRIRFTVTHIYSLFANVKDLTIVKDLGMKNVFQVVHQAEKIPASVQSYREKLLHLQALEFHSQSMANLNTKYNDFPLRYLLGNLYVNFSLLWDPICGTIASYGNKQCPHFWTTFLSEINGERILEEVDTSMFECKIITSLVNQVLHYNENIDGQNYKLLLWKCMSRFPDYCEARNRDLTGIFIDFVEREYFRSNSEDAKSFNIQKNTEEKDEKEDVEAVTSQTMGRKLFKTKLLLAQLELFGKMSSPKTLYREAEVYKIYLDLLCSKNVELQKGALNCILRYKHKYLLPYKDQLNGLMNEKELKNELSRFKINRESKVVEEDHREGLMPIVMRIVYAKMVQRVGLRTGGKAGGLNRRKMILRFLAGSEENEMLLFAKMAFRPFHKYIAFSPDEVLDLEHLVRNVATNVDLTNVTPPKQLQSSVNLLMIIIEQFGAKMTKLLLPRLLALLFCILAEVRTILAKSEQIHSGFIKSIKNARTSCIDVLGRFFEHFEDYEWSTAEIDALFEVAVFPWLKNLPTDGIHSPTALLKMFVTWSKNPRYFPLLAKCTGYPKDCTKHEENFPILTPLPYIVQLLSNKKTSYSVVNAITEMFEKLLTLEDYEAQGRMEVDEKAPALDNVIGNKVHVERAVLPEGINFGSSLLLPFVPEILEFMKGKLKRSKGINRTELLILSRISELTKDASICDTLLELAIPILIARSARGASEETLIELLTTVTNLTKNVTRPEKHVISIIPLLSMISSSQTRKLLINLLEIIARRVAEVEEKEEWKVNERADKRNMGIYESLSREEIRKRFKNFDLLNDLNAWDKRWIDQPDIEKRLDCFKKINTLVESEDLSLELGSAIIHCCFFFLSTLEDLAIRDYAGQCMRKVGVKLANLYKDSNAERKYLIEDTILNLVRKGIRTKKEAELLQSIGFLGHMAAECPEVHPVLRDLSLLTNKTDLEVDFFENMQHLQLHRKGRALRKFCTIAETLKKPPNAKTLTQFILPLASSYLCNETFLHKNSIVDDAIQTVATVCRLLPWYHYEIILKYYLEKLKRVEFQKQVVRIIVAILDAFHYDLSKYTIAGIVQEPRSKDNNDDDKKEEEEEADEPKQDDTDAKIAEEDENEEDELDAALESKDVEQKAESSEKSERIEDEFAVLKQTVLSPSVAQKLVFSISKGLLPQLHRAILARTQHETSHKVNRKETGAKKEEEELLRVPVALAVVKLLQKLPENLLLSNLPGIFMKLCTFLKSRLDSVRRATRVILQNIMITLGPNYLHLLLREMNGLLTKGFQVHVLVYTVHAVLDVLKPYFTPANVNPNLQSIISVCKVDLFGLTAEEKEVAAIVRNVSEAKSTKSYSIFNILSQYIDESCMLDILEPLKIVLLKTHSHKTMDKVVKCLNQIALGFSVNNFIKPEQMLIFLLGVVSESIPQLLPRQKKEKPNEKEAKVLGKIESDCFLIQPEPKNRMGEKTRAKVSKNTNLHSLVEFGLRLFDILLRKNPSDRNCIITIEFTQYLDPFVEILSDCLKSQHVKLSTLALQCCKWILKLLLPSLNEKKVGEICSSIFSILHKYAVDGLSKGDNCNLVAAAFKTMSVLVRDVKYFTINEEQLKMLIIYIEQDLHDSDRHATAFRLLRAIIGRKLMVPEMHALMQKIAELSITSELPHVREQARAALYTYLLQYPVGKHIDKLVAFYANQLSYELQPGRLSALDMVYSITAAFPQDLLSSHSGYLFLMLGARLVNDEDPTCKKNCAKCIKEMINRVSNNQRSKLFEIVVLWLKDRKISHRRLAAQLCGIFVTVENESFESRLPEVLPLVVKQFYNDVAGENIPGRYVKLHDGEKKSDVSIKDPERMHDHHIFQVLQLLLKISICCKGFFKNPEYRDFISSIGEQSQILLGHSHLWVRLGASELLGHILTSLDKDKVEHLLKNPEIENFEVGYVYSNPVETIRSLTLDLIAQLQPDMTLEKFADMISKNLICIAELLQSVKVSPSPSNAENGDDEQKERKNDLSLFWVIKKMRKAVNVEITQSPNSTCVRSAVFKFIGGMIAKIPMENLKPLLFNMMSPLVREMSTTEVSNAPLRQLAKKVAGMMKKNISEDDYTRLLNRAEQRLNTRRAERKKIRTQQFVTDPELAAKRKISRQQKKKEAKKRKIEKKKNSHKH